ncbi:MAG TPA: hypothetical protein VFG42_23035 [Baekduia sp.]|uniref:hypothetical protein n=1 Tax=Baekduia sp. TaxID=2600305 RepID=UPI002D79DF09|nr:hypothetical protein [Baekduia sp.]HET6509690.1 hypothetical protein [Baekduia sp.]
MMNEAHKEQERRRLHTASPHLPVPVRADDEELVDLGSPLVLAAVVVVAVVVGLVLLVVGS